MNFGFERIHILQSLPEGDRNTGRALYEFLQDLLVSQDLLDVNNYISFYKPETAEDFLKTLADIRDHLLDTGKIPLTRLLCFAISGVNVILLGPHPSSG